MFDWIARGGGVCVCVCVDRCGLNVSALVHKGHVILWLQSPAPCITS